jgi:hypothetical protein
MIGQPVQFLENREAASRPELPQKQEDGSSPPEQETLWLPAPRKARQS